jgi:hypothetical protein
MAKVTGISPVLLVADIHRSVEYFREQLGFDCEVFGEPPNFATANRDVDTILLTLTEKSEQIVPNWQIVDKMWDAYRHARYSRSSAGCSPRSSAGNPNEHKR